MSSEKNSISSTATISISDSEAFPVPSERKNGVLRRCGRLLSASCYSYRRDGFLACPSIDRLKNFAALSILLQSEALPVTAIILRLTMEYRPRLDQSLLPLSMQSRYRSQR